MRDLLFLIPAIPLASSLALGLFGRRISRKAVGVLGSGSIGLAALVCLAFCIAFLKSGAPSYAQSLWTWIEVAGFQPRIALRLDALSLLMSLVVTFVGFVIHLYSIDYMAGDPGYSRFFAYMNLFVASMLTLVLADDLLLLYLGWEGVGLCSYLLIGFWYDDPLNGLAARKAFLVTRVGDTAMAVGLFWLFSRLGTLAIPELLGRAQAAWPAGSTGPIVASALLLGGAVGKSAQLPLQTWLPDAMLGPTPVSALIHAATMVTAGVYLIARMHALFLLAPPVEHAVAIIGAATLLLASFSALTQREIKRILAYSTISQIGYMFLALGVGAWSEAMFHFMTHAFFKALLFLGAGAVILALEHENDIFRMGGLRRELPWVFWPFLAGAASLSAVPFVTAGFYSKDLILAAAYSSPLGSPWLWAAGIVGAFLTALYSFRMVFVVFFGEAPEHRQNGDATQYKGPRARKQGPLMLGTLVPLAVLSLVAGAVKPVLPGFLANVFHEASWVGQAAAWIAAAPSIAALAGIALAYFLYVPGAPVFERALKRKPLLLLHRFWFSGWGFDWLYDRALVRPFALVARLNHADAIDLVFDATAWICLAANRALRAAQTGRIRWYAAVIAGGAAVLIVLTEVL